MNYRAALAIAVAVLALSYGGVWAWNRHKQAQASQLSTESTQSHGEAIAHVDQAHALESQEKQQAQALRDAESKVADLKAKLARALQQPKGSMQPPGDPVGGDHGVPASPPQPVVDDGLKDQIIAAQDVQIQGLKAQVVTISASRDQWKGAYEASERSRIAEGMAKDAALAAVKASRWQGRIEGFAVGVAAGLAGGKL